MLNKIIILIKYWRQISRPTVLIPIKKAVSNDNKIIFQLLIFSSKNKLSTIVNEMYVLIVQNDKNWIFKKIATNSKFFSNIL